MGLGSRTTTWDVDVLYRGEWKRVPVPIEVRSFPSFAAERAYQEAFKEVDRLPWLRIAIDPEEHNPDQRAELLRSNLVEGVRVTQRDR